MVPAYQVDVKYKLYYIGARLWLVELKRGG